MNTYSEYPVFEPNQVLSYTHLNDLVNYLEKQDRLTRNKLIGIGIACGLKVDWKFSQEVLYISKGVAVTSEGYLIYLEENFYDKFLPYALPKTSMEDSGIGEVEENPYHFFQDSNGEEIEKWELFPTDYVPEEGEDVPNALTESFLEEKVILLYLECQRESLRNCDINDCSDKGAKMTFEVRVLAINESDGIEILNKEKEIANRPVHQHEHPKYELSHLDIEKINPAGYELKNFQEIYVRIAEILSNLNPSLTAALTDSFEAYKYLLTEVYPEANFPSGPFNNISNHFSNVTNDFIQNVISLQYLYDYYYDVVQGYNEFTHFAHQLIVECSPYEGRFPKHVLLGKAVQDASAFIPPAIGSSFDPLTAQTGLAPTTKPLQYRHYFIPSMIFEGQNKLLRKVRSLHYRLYLSAYRYDTEMMEGSDIRITPSKDGDYFLSDKAIPFYYAFNSADDFHANWSYDKTTRNRMNRVFSYQFTQSVNHPLLNKMDDHNFYRIEGHVGQGLATVMKNLSTQKKDLGLSFAIEPVFIGITGDDEADDLAMNDLIAAARRLFMCKMRDLDVIFLILIALLFFLLFVLLILLSRIGRSAYGMRSLSGDDTNMTVNERVFNAERSTDFINKKIVRQDSDQVLAKIRKEKGYVKGTVVNEINKDPEAEIIGNIYLEINAESSDTNLYDRTLRVVKRKSDKGVDNKNVAEDLYPTVALMDSTEEVMKSLSTETVAKFDFELFENRYSNFVEAYQNFEAQEVSPVLQKDENYLEAKAYTHQKKSQLATTNTQSLLGNMSSEFAQRFLNILSEMTLPGYAKKHPGLEHKAGVTRGGTFILLYAHRDFVNEEFLKLLGNLRSNFNLANVFTPTNSLNLSNIAAFPINNAVNAEAFNTTNVMVNATRSNDPLDNFIVLGDFCIPTQCCEGNCSDIIEDDIKPTTGTLTGKVVDAEKGGIIHHAKVTAVNLSTNNATDTIVDGNGSYKLELEPAGYNVTASANGFNPKSQTKTISSGQNTTLSFQLDFFRSGLMMVEEIANGTAGYDVNSPMGKEAMTYYGSRYSYYNAYKLKLNADASSDNDKKVAEQVRSSLDTMLSVDTDLTKLNREIKRVNNALMKLHDTAKGDNDKLRVNESIKVVNNAYLDKLSLISADDISRGTKNALNEVEKINKKSDVSMSKIVKDWVKGQNLSSKPKITEMLGKLKFK